MKDHGGSEYHHTKHVIILCRSYYYSDSNRFPDMKMTNFIYRISVCSSKVQAVSFLHCSAAANYQVAWLSSVDSESYPHPRGYVDIEGQVVDV